MIARIRAVGARIKFLIDGDVAGALMALLPESEVDILVGIGGTPEGVIAACAAQCLGGAIYGRLTPRNDAESRAARNMGHRLDRILTTTDLVRGDNAYFVATGVTDGEVLRGVRYAADQAVTQTLSIRSSSGAVRTIDTKHRISTSTLIPWRD